MSVARNDVWVAPRVTPQLSAAQHAAESAAKELSTTRTALAAAEARLKVQS